MYCILNTHIGFTIQKATDPDCLTVLTALRLEEIMKQKPIDIDIDIDVDVDIDIDVDVDTDTDTDGERVQILQGLSINPWTLHASHQLSQAQETEKFVAANTIFPFGTQVLFKKGFQMASMHTQKIRSCFQPSTP